MYVVDREFGDQLAQLKSGVPVWIVDTLVNRVVAQRLWKERNQENHLTGITAKIARVCASSLNAVRAALHTPEQIENPPDTSN